MIRILISTGGGDPVNYLQALAAVGGRGEAKYLPEPGPEYDGLLLAGGDDMDPELFGQENRGSRGIDRARDRAELALLGCFLGAGKPVLAICRGHQAANVWLGGDLVQDMAPEAKAFHARTEGVPEDKVHPVRAEAGTLLHRLYGSVFSVNSAHHQCVGRLGAGLIASARSEGGVVEGLEHPSLPLISVQFHPERMTGRLARQDTVDGQAVFRHFIRLCRRRQG